jgi:GT2 family glycosyltransferase
MSGQAAIEEDLTTAYGSVFADLDDDRLLGPAPMVTAAKPEAPDSAAADDTPGYDEGKYLRVYPDVAMAVRAGDYPSGRQHYLRFGRDERRLDKLEYRHGWPVADSPKFPTFGVDAVFWCASGRALVIGWIDDTDVTLRSLGLMLHETLLGATDAIARCRREDAERAVGASEGRLLGFWTMFECRTDVRSSDIRIVLMTQTEQRSAAAAVQSVSDERLREIAFEYLAHASYWGNAQVEGFDQLEGGLGHTLIAANDAISQRFVAGAFCRRFGPQRSRFAASIVVCLYGKMEYMFLQAALFTTGSEWQDYEFVYVTNSPELAERMFKEAALITQIYGLSITLVILPGNAGFGAANNAGVAHAQSDRIMIVNPDVFPREHDWAVRHKHLVEHLPEDQTRIFGVPLFYDDGSLMHGGMFFELDEGLSIAPTGIKRRELVRVEHYGKGAPPGTERFLRSRPVPAVTGAFLSIARGWYESLGGFSPDFVFGHYEDADLCLRSLSSGSPVWMHNIGFWHMEGKGSTRRTSHEGGSLVNRWHFTRSWADLIRDDLLGPNPARLSSA